MEKRVFIYARRSSEKNKGKSVSIEKQITEITKKCEKEWFIIEWIYQENKSWYVAWKRNEFLNMLEDIKNRNIKGKWNKIDYLYVYMVSRLARNKKEADVITELVINNKLKILSVKEAFESWLKWEKKLILDLTDAIYESKEKSEDWKYNMDISYKEKWKISQRLPYWYTIVWKWERSKVKITNEYNEWEIVKKVFNEYMTWKYTYVSLAKKLNKEWFQKSYSKKWVIELQLRKFTEKDIENILIKSFYRGKVEIEYKNLTESEIEYFREKYPDKEINDSVIIDYTNILKECWTFDPIISKFIFDKCEDIRNWKGGKNKTNLTSVKKWSWFAIFKWILKCNCKSCITDNINEWNWFTQEIQKWKFYYRCSNNKKSWVNCDNVFVSESILENYIYDSFIKWIIFDENEIAIFKKIIEDKLKELWKIKEWLWVMLKKNLIKLKKESEKYYDNYINEDDEELKVIHKKRFKETKNEITDLENQLNNLPNVVNEKEKHIDNYIYYINKIWTNFQLFPRERKQQILKALFNYIVVYNKEIVDFKLNPIFELAYNKKKVLPLNENSVISKKMGSNSNNGLNKTKRIQSNDYILNGTPTRSRTLLTGFGILDSNR